MTHGAFASKAGTAVRALAVPAFLFVCAPASAQVLVNPVVVEMAAKQRIAAVAITLGDHATAPLRMQAQVLRWTQDAKGEAVTEPSNDLLVSPAISEIRPGQTQLFRIALRGARPSPAELAYRLVLDDVSESVAPAPADGSSATATVSLRMRYDLPVMVAPAAPVVQKVRWHSCPDASAAAEVCVRLRNDGNRRVKVQTLTLGGDGWSQNLSFTQGINVLAGAEREWRTPLAAGHTGPVRTVHILTADAKQIEAEPGG